MINANSLLPLPVVATYNPLSRQVDEEEQARLKENALPPVEQPAASERSADRRRLNQDAEELRAGSDGHPDPGQLIDSYA